MSDWKAALAASTSRPDMKARVEAALLAWPSPADDLGNEQWLHIEEAAEAYIIELRRHYDIQPQGHYGVTAKVVISPGWAIEIYDTGKRRYSRLSINRLEGRVAGDYRKGWA